MLNIVKFELDKHYLIISNWYFVRNLPIAPTTFLPPTGLLVYNESVPVCSAFLVKSDANAAIISNIVSNPDTDKFIRSEALDMLLTELYKQGIEDGFKIICCSSASKPVQERLIKLSFTLTDNNISNFGRV